MRYAIVEAGVVQNVCEWDGETAWGESERAVEVPDGQPVEAGWTWDGAVFAAAPADEKDVSEEAPVVEERTLDLEARLAELEKRADALEAAK